METKQLMKVVKKPPVDIEFNNVSYKVGNKEVLHAVSGKFSSGQLVGIFGASGAGKTTLLNILTGHLLSGASGEILVNDAPRDMKKFRKMSAYIMQEDNIQPMLTVLESVTIATNLKLGNLFTMNEKLSVIQDVLSVIGLHNCADTMVENLSGGQKKRLTIALELVNNPPVIFLDEPTTGLDNVAMKNCVDLLKSLTTQGRTVICTVHQPSDSMLKLFDVVYFLSDGYCIYNGSVADMVPFLSDCGFECPKTYSPADYIIEVVHFNDSSTRTLTDGIKNGKLIKFNNKLYPMYKNRRKEFVEADRSKQFDEFPINFWSQFWILMYRKFLQLKRNKVQLFLEMLHHSLSAFFLGILFYGIGNSGVNSYNNIKLYLGTVVYLMYTHLLGPILLFPGEIVLLKKEYFNRWYSLKAFFAASSLCVLPMMFITSLTFLLIVYPMTGQPMECDRLFWFLLINIMMALTADGFGYVIGSIFPPVNGATIGSALSLPLVLVSTYNVGHADDASEASRFSAGLSFPYQAWVALSTAMLRDRPPFECEEIFCYFGTPQFLLKKMGMEGRDPYTATLVLGSFLVVFKCASYVALRFRVSQQYGLIGTKLKPLMKFCNYEQM